jgi:manganese efflux pump family protein
MPVWTVLAIAVALSMDAFAVAVVCGIADEKFGFRHTFRLAWHFGLFQALMPTIGWFAGSAFQALIENFDHWLAFGFLAFVGVRMIVGALRSTRDEEARTKDPTRGWSLMILSVATSIDALAVGLSLAMLKVPILKPAVIIGIVTMTITAAGSQARFLVKRTSLLGRWSELIGGLVLLGIGIKILIEHQVV